MKRVVVLAICFLAAGSPMAFARGGGGHSGGGKGSGASHHGSRSSSAGPGTGSKEASTHVSGYDKRSGTHVAGHDRSTADTKFQNNWSTKGNVNPKTGKAGTRVTAPAHK